MACLAVVALFAIANSATAITCTLDQRPAATLLVPYFQVSIDAATAPSSAAATWPATRSSRSANASSAPMVAHVNVYDRFSHDSSRLQHRPDGFRRPVDGACLRSSRGHLPVTLNSSGRRRLPARGDIVRSTRTRDGFLRVSPTSVPGQTSRRPRTTTSTATTAYSGTFFAIARGAHRRRTATATRIDRPGDRLHRDRPRQLLQPVRSDRPELLHQRRDRHGEQPVRRDHLHLGQRPADLRHVDRQPRGGHDPRRRHPGVGQRRPGRPHVLCPVLDLVHETVCTNCGSGATAPTSTSGQRSVGRGLRRPA